MHRVAEEGTTEIGSEFLHRRSNWCHGLHELVGDGDVGGITDVTIRARVKGDATVVLPFEVVLLPRATPVLAGAVMKRRLLVRDQQVEHVEGQDIHGLQKESNFLKTVSLSGYPSCLLGLQHEECGHCLLEGVGDLRHEPGVPGFAVFGPCWCLDVIQDYEDQLSNTDDRTEGVQESMTEIDENFIDKIEDVPVVLQRQEGADDCGVSAGAVH